LPSAISDLKKLRRINVSSNKLTDLPASIGSLAALRDLDISRNRLLSLPIEMSALSLKNFDASLNPLLSPHGTVLRNGFDEVKKHLSALSKSLSANPPEKRFRLTQRHTFVTDDSIGLSGKAGMELSDKVKWYTKRAPEMFYTVELAAQETIGRREKMEDRKALGIFPLKDTGGPAYIFGAYDGHGGSECCDAIIQQLHAAIARQVEFKLDTLEQALVKGYAEFENSFIEEAKKNRWVAGSTTVTAILANNTLVVGWLGDCRAVLIDSTTGVRLTNDHTCKNPEEKARVLSVPGGKVEMDEKDGGVLRVQGKCVVTRALGDILLKLPNQYLSPVPETKVMQLNPRHQFIVLGSDGLWEWVAPQWCTDQLKKNGIGRLQDSADAFIKKTRDANGRDNALCIVAALEWFVEPLKK